MIFFQLFAFLCYLTVINADGHAEFKINYTIPSEKAILFQVKKPIIIHCEVRNYKEGAAGKKWEIHSSDWLKDGVLIKDVVSLKDRYKIDWVPFFEVGTNNTLIIANSEYSDAGNWSCASRDVRFPGSADIFVASNVAVKIKTRYINVVENEKLRIECNVLGNPQPILTWKVQSDNYNGSNFDDRVTITNFHDDNGREIINGAFIIESVNENDRGEYLCIGQHQYDSTDTQETLSEIRVKDKYAALWPFIGICIEVIVLCTIIIIYEKKRNKTELEESDTDQSPDQKNTPDHGGKDANLRHRQ